MWTGEGVKKSKNFADILSGRDEEVEASMAPNLGDLSPPLSISLGRSAAVRETLTSHVHGCLN